MGRGEHPRKNHHKKVKGLRQKVEGLTPTPQTSHLNKVHIGKAYHQEKKLKHTGN